MAATASMAVAEWRPVSALPTSESRALASGMQACIT